MRRRDFIGGVGTLLSNWTIPAFAQQSGRTRRIGVLMGFPANAACKRFLQISGNGFSANVGDCFSPLLPNF
jgi:hypothetical protein